MNILLVAAGIAAAPLFSWLMLSGLFGFLNLLLCRPVPARRVVMAAPVRPRLSSRQVANA